MIVKRPISAGNLALKIIRHFEELKEQEKLQQAEEAAAAPETSEAPAGSTGETQETSETENTAAPAESAKSTPEEVSEAERDAANSLKSADVMDKDELLKQIDALSAEINAPAPAEKKHILVIDDDRTVLKMLKTALSDKYNVTTMVNGIMAVKFLESKKVDLVILDYEMPVETGAAVFRKIKASPKAKNIPVCFLTGISDREKIMEVMSLKPHGYMLKPIDMDMLFSTINNLI